MALSNLYDWHVNHAASACGAACGSACGAADDPKR